LENGELKTITASAVLILATRSDSDKQIITLSPIHYDVLILPIHVIWGCIPEIERGCIDRTNASSTYLSIAIGAVVVLS
jgi:hypothetical protein